jgi:cytoskeletal protein RodZ
MATSSFANINDQNWEPTSMYQQVQIMIQSEVDQGLWENHEQPSGWCLIATSDPHGVSSSWVTHTYQQISDTTQTSTVIWPASWPPPAENVNGELPAHFFSSVSTTVTQTSAFSPTSLSAGASTTGEGNTAKPLSQTSAAPVNPPTYRVAGQCV